MKKYLFNIIKLLSLSAIFFLLFTVLLLFLFRWINPPVTAFIMEKSAPAEWIFHSYDHRQEWVGTDKIDNSLILAVVASEDQKFFEHSGFDLEQVKIALDNYSQNKRLRGASTITQQLAKNLFLTPSKTFIRKFFEAYYTALIEVIWSKERILEVYMNVAETGKNIYGFESAAKHYFSKGSSRLNRNEAASLAAILPNPVRYNPLKPTGYILRRKTHILRQMELMGGEDYIRGMMGNQPIR